MLKTRLVMLALGTFICFCSYFEAAFAEQGHKNSGAQTVTTEVLGGDQRYLIYLSTDKPIYRAQETLYMRAVFLHASDNTPLSQANADISVKIVGPRGDLVFQGLAQGDDSAVGLKWLIPEGISGGEYTLQVKSNSIGAPEAQRHFDIRAYRAPRINSQIEFLRDAYGAGETVSASVKIERVEGGIPLGAKVNIIARVDGKEVFNKANVRVDKSGVISTEFALPASMDMGEGSLAFIIEDGGVVETASQIIPIVLQNLDVSFFPEGGDLISGLSSRVYVQTRAPNGKPADIEGRIMLIKNGKVKQKTLIRIKTTHEGRGLFEFKPKKGQQYALMLDSPSGISRQFLLPEVKGSGAVFSKVKSQYNFDEKIEFTVEAKGVHLGKVTLHKREILLDSQAFTDEKNNGSRDRLSKASQSKSTQSKVRVSLNPEEQEGVLVATVWSESGYPLAERLVYRAPKFELNISIEANRKNYVPGDSVELTVTAKDQNGQPVEAVVGLTVSDDAVIQMIEKREQAARLPVMVYLENEVNDMADAHVYLDKENDQASQALDLLLGTQGWRRFILSDYSKIKEQYPKLAPRALAEKIVKLNIYAKRKLARKAGLDPEPVMEMMAVNEAIRPRDNGVLHEEDVILDEAKAVEQGPAVQPIKQDARNDKKDEQNEGGKRLARVQGIAQMFEAPMFEPPIFEQDALMDVKRRLVVVREYAHVARKNRQANDRSDFTETLYWNKGLRTNTRTGKATVSFDLSDSVTSFRVMADAFGRNGALGDSDSMIQSIEPFYIEPKLPLTATVGDVIQVPVSMVNASLQSLDNAQLIVKSEGLDLKQPKAINLKADERARQFITLKLDEPGELDITFSAAAGGYTDTVTRTLLVRPKGFPIVINHGGLVSEEHDVSFIVNIPKSAQQNSVETLVKVYPSPVANMEEALNALLRQPMGCFEQTSSSNYPLVMAQQYFLSHQGVDPEKIAKAKKLLNAGYIKLTGFESKDKGYEWFGANPAHEALTAYGLMEFVDMAKVMSVDSKMIERTRGWLLDRRDGKGGFKQNKKALDSFGRAPAPTTNAYIIWSLLESGESPASLKKEIDAIKREAENTKDTYVVALAANILFLSGDDFGANKMAEKLYESLHKDGYIDSAVTSITRSGGIALNLEVTSLALLAWLKNDSRWAAQVETSMTWLFEQSKSGRFGSTQSTILSLKAINAYDLARSQPKNPGYLQLVIDGKPFGNRVSFDKNSKGAIELPNFSAALNSGEHEVAIVMSNGSKMPFALEVNYSTLVPNSASENPIKLDTQLNKKRVTEGELIELTARVIVGRDDAPTPMAIIGIPAGLELQHDQLKSWVGEGKISAYEEKDGDLVLYWRALRAGETRKLDISLMAAIPGSFMGSAGRTYLYYTDEIKHWQAGEVIEIKARR
ncbi:MAG: hypothetical protein ACI93R_003808 [Flavobacteriales bacterium]|jgi:hypothetical protein